MDTHGLTSPLWASTLAAASVISLQLMTFLVPALKTHPSEWHGLIFSPLSMISVMTGLDMTFLHAGYRFFFWFCFHVWWQCSMPWWPSPSVRWCTTTPLKVCLEVMPGSTHWSVHKHLSPFYCHATSIITNDQLFNTTAKMPITCLHTHAQTLT